MIEEFRRSGNKEEYFSLQTVEDQKEILNALDFEEKKDLLPKISCDIIIELLEEYKLEPEKEKEVLKCLTNEQLLEISQKNKNNIEKEEAKKRQEKEKEKEKERVTSDTNTLIIDENGVGKIAKFLNVIVLNNQEYFLYSIDTSDKKEAIFAKKIVKDDKGEQTLVPIDDSEKELIKNAFDVQALEKENTKLHNTIEENKKEIFNIGSDATISKAYIESNKEIISMNKNKAQKLVEKKKALLEKIVRIQLKTNNKLGLFSKLRLKILSRSYNNLELKTKEIDKKIKILEKDNEKYHETISSLAEKEYNKLEELEENQKRSEEANKELEEKNMFRAQIIKPKSKNELRNLGKKLFSQHINTAEEEILTREKTIEQEEKNQTDLKDKIINDTTSLFSSRLIAETGIKPVKNIELENDSRINSEPIAKVPKNKLARFIAVVGISLVKGAELYAASQVAISQQLQTSMKYRDGEDNEEYEEARNRGRGLGFVSLPTIILIIAALIITMINVILALK